MSRDVWPAVAESAGRCFQFTSSIDGCKPIEARKAYAALRKRTTGSIGVLGFFDPRYIDCIRHGLKALLKHTRQKSRLDKMLPEHRLVDRILTNLGASGDKYQHDLCTAATFLLHFECFFTRNCSFGSDGEILDSDSAGAGGFLLGQVRYDIGVRFSSDTK